jgi:hypothetical protein
MPKRSYRKTIRKKVILHSPKTKKFGFKRNFGHSNNFGTSGVGLIEETKQFLNSVSNYFKTPEVKDEEDDEEKNDQTLESFVLDKLNIEPPINPIPYHITSIKTALVIIAPQNLYIKNKEELLIRLSDLIEIAKDRITDVYCILFSKDMSEQTNMYDGTNFLVPKILTDTFQLCLNKPNYIVQDNHYFKDGLPSFYDKILDYDKILIVSFLEPERNIFLKQLIGHMDVFTRKIARRHVPKIVLIKDLDSDLIDENLDSRVETVAITHALDNDTWTSDIVQVRTRNTWLDEPNNKNYADPEITEDNRVVAKSVILKRSRLHSGPVIKFKDGIPINPFAQEYMFSGKGTLPYYGPNFITYIILSRRNNYDNTGQPIIEILVRYDRKTKKYDLVHYFDAIDTIMKYLHQTLGIALYNTTSSNLKYEGPLKHDSRETKNSWIEASLYNWSLTNSSQEIRLDHDHYQWIPINNVSKYIDFNGRKELEPIIEKIKI